MYCAHGNRLHLYFEMVSVSLQMNSLYLDYRLLSR